MWNNKNVWIILIGEFIVGLGLWAGIIGNLQFMTNLVPSDFHKSIIITIGILAGFLVGPLAGKLIDRFPKKTVLIWSSVLRIISVIFMFIAIRFDSVIWMVIFLIVLQIAAAFFMPAMQAIVPLVVSAEHLLTMNAWHMNVRTISRIIGTAAAGFMVSVLPLIWLYIASIVMYVAMLLCTFSLSIPEDRSATKEKQNGSFKDVLPMLTTTPVVMMAFCLAIIPTLFLGSFNLVIINIVELQQNPSISGLLYTVEGIGFMAGAFLVKRITHFIPLKPLLFSISFGIGLLDFTLLFAHISWAPLVTFGLFGFAVGCFFPTMMTIFQLEIPKTHHGRFFSFRNMFDSVLFQVVLLSTGGLLDLVGLQLMGIIFGCISLSLTLFFVFYVNKQAKKIHPPETVTPL